MEHIIRWRRLLSITTILLGSTFADDALVQNFCSPMNTGEYYAGVTNHYDSLGSCDTQCQGDYAFAVVQGETCWCSNYAPGSQLSISQCDSTCPGYPYEYCGNTANNLYGYLQLSNAAWGTSYTAPVTVTSALAQTLASPTTVVLTSAFTIISTKQIISTQVNTIAASPSTAILSVTVFETSTQTQRLTVIPVAPTSPSITVSTSTSLATSTYIQHVTVSGTTEVVTEIVTSIATLAPESSPSPLVTHGHAGISSGAAAGAAVGAVLGAAIIGAILYFCCCWRRKQQSGDSGGESGLDRNISVLSKAGLLRRTSQRDATSRASTFTPRLQTTGLPSVQEDPRSAATMASAGTMMSSASNSRPLFVDQRLNPNGHSMGHHMNASTSSIGSIRDYRDYSRPLEVRNPDPP